MIKCNNITYTFTPDEIKDVIKEGLGLNDLDEQTKVIITFNLTMDNSDDYLERGMSYPVIQNVTVALNANGNTN